MKFIMAISVNNHFYTFDTIMPKMCRLRKFMVRALLGKNKKVFFQKTELKNNPFLESSLTGLKSVSKKAVENILKGVAKAGGLDKVLEAKLNSMIGSEIEPAIKHLYNFFKELSSLTIFAKTNELLTCLVKASGVGGDDVKALKSFLEVTKVIGAKGWPSFVTIMTNAMCKNKKGFKSALKHLLTAFGQKDVNVTWSSLGKSVGQFASVLGKSK